MKRTGLILFGLMIGWGRGIVAYGQGDLAVFETFTRFASAVFSLEVEISKEQILQQIEDSARKLREYQEYYADTVTGSTKTVINYNLIDTLMDHWGRQLDMIKKLSNNRINGAGFAVTAHHLITLSTLIKSATIFVMDDNNQVVGNAKVQGIDSMTGIAVLRVDDATFSNYVELEHPSISLPVASYVMSIQRPYTLPASPYSGMIGGYMRQMKLFPLERYIQTDLPLFPGNEGSPVFSPTGQLIGMMATEFHIAKWPSITFVIPAELVINSAKPIIEDGKKEYYWITGLALRQVDAKIRGQLDSRILVEDVEAESAVYKAGIRKGDVILEFNGNNIHQLKDLVDKILTTKPQHKVYIKVLRGNENLNIQVATAMLNH